MSPCRRCGGRLDRDAAFNGREVCTPCGVAAKQAFLPAIGEPDPAALRYIDQVWDQIPEHAEFRRHGQAPVLLRQLIWAEAEAIRKQAPFRAMVVAAVERETGVPC